MKKLKKDSRKRAIRKTTVRVPKKKAIEKPLKPSALIEWA